MPDLRNPRRKQATGGHLRHSINTVVYALAASYHFVTIDPAAPEYHTDIGQHSAVTLKDRSEIRLGGGTSIKVNDAAHFRTVRLERGEILAAVRPDSDRPFQVVDGHLIAFNLGTTYDYVKHGSISNIAVLDGQVRLYQRNGLDQRGDPIVAEAGVYRRAPVILSAGDLARIEQRGDGTVIVTRAHAGLDVARQRTQWLEGEIVASGQRLDEVIWEFNRYNQTQIVIDDPNLGSMIWGGAVSLRNVEGLIGVLRLQQHMDVEIVKGDDGQTTSYHLKGVAAPVREKNLHAK